MFWPAHSYLTQESTCCSIFFNPLVQNLQQLVPSASVKDIQDALEASKGDTNAAVDNLLNKQPGSADTENTSVKDMQDALEAAKGDTNAVVASVSRSAGI